MESLTPDEATWISQVADRFKSTISQALIGRPEVIELTIVALLAEGHVLLEDVPGTGKTTLARAVADAIAGTWRRIQFTPDLLPSDVTGAQVYNQSTASFEFHPGAIFANIVLADEINRASPKTQSALLEVMQEHQHTVDGKTYPVPRPFIVLATQNPIELEGTYRLPEAQLDRFLMKTSIGYPPFESEVAIVARASSRQTEIASYISADQVGELVSMVDRLYTSTAVIDYIVKLATATRENDEVELGVSPRGAVALVRASRALAAVRGEPFVTPDHVKELVQPVFGHRMILTPDAELAGIDVATVLAEVLTTVNPPLERVG